MAAPLLSRLNWACVRLSINPQRPCILIRQRSLGSRMLCELKRSGCKVPLFLVCFLTGLLNRSEEDAHTVAVFLLLWVFSLGYNAKSRSTSALDLMKFRTQTGQVFWALSNKERKRKRKAALTKEEGLRSRSMIPLPPLERDARKISEGAWGSDGW